MFESDKKINSQILFINTTSIQVCAASFTVETFLFFLLGSLNEKGRIPAEFTTLWPSHGNSCMHTEAKHKLVDEKLPEKRRKTEDAKKCTCFAIAIERNGA